MIWRLCSITALWLLCFCLECSSEFVGDIRLLKGNTINEGQVQVYLGKRGWFNTCDRQWGMSEAIVVCRQLGYPGAVMAIASAGTTTGIPLARTWNCTGDEARLLNCHFTPTYICDDAAAVICHVPGYLGCYEDQMGLLSSALSEDYLIERDMTVDRCRRYCMQRHWRIIGLKNGIECYCGAAESELANHPRLSDAECQIMCPGNPNQVCGGSRDGTDEHDKLSVFDVNLGDCANPGEPDNGRALDDNFQFGDIVRYECDPGYEIVGVPAIQCILSPGGERQGVMWSTSIPSCALMPTTEALPTTEGMTTVQEVETTEETTTAVTTTKPKTTTQMKTTKMTTEMTTTERATTKSTTEEPEITTKRQTTPAKTTEATTPKRTTKTTTIESAMTTTSKMTTEPKPVTEETPRPEEPTELTTEATTETTTPEMKTTMTTEEPMTSMMTSTSDETTMMQRETTETPSGTDANEPSTEMMTSSSKTDDTSKMPTREMTSISDDDVVTHTTENDVTDFTDFIITDETPSNNDTASNDARSNTFNLFALLSEHAILIAAGGTVLILLVPLILIVIFKKACKRRKKSGLAEIQMEKTIDYELGSETTGYTYEPLQHPRPRYHSFRKGFKRFSKRPWSMRSELEESSDEEL